MTQPSILIEPSTDARKLSAVARASFLETFADTIGFDDIAARAQTEDSVEGFEAAIRNGNALWLASVEATGTPVGFAMTCAPELPEIATTEDDLELKRIYLLSRFQGGGTGYRLLRAVVELASARGATRLLLGVHAENPAVRWYERQGFRKIGERSFRVGDSWFDDHIMALTLA